MPPIHVPRLGDSAVARGAEDDGHYAADRGGGTQGEYSMILQTWCDTKSLSLAICDRQLTLNLQLTSRLVEIA